MATSTIITVMTTRMRLLTMTEAAALYRLLAWLSPGYPIGAYTYSHGLEQAIEAGLMDNAERASAWILIRN